MVRDACDVPAMVGTHLFVTIGTERVQRAEHHYHYHDNSIAVPVITVRSSRENVLFVFAEQSLNKNGA